MTIRLKYNNKTLENYWIDKMQAINFDFEPHDTNWLNTYNKVKALIHQKESMSVNDIGSTAYAWIFNNTKRLNQGKLDNKHAELMVALNSLYPSQTWEQTAHEVKIEWEQKERLPTLSSNKKLSNWLKVQKVRYRKGSLTAAQIKTLESIGFDFEDGKKKNEQKWLNQFEAYKKFKEENGTEPSAIDDYKLHIWVQTQRALKAGTLRNRLIMAKEREDLLNSIHFNWVSIGSNKTWKDYFEDFLGYVKEGRIKIPVRIEGALNPTYSWFHNQKTEFKKGNLDVNKIEQFKKAGIDLSAVRKNNV